jgi:hypothetical protein
MSHHQTNLEPLNVFEFLLTVLFVSKAAVPCVSSGWPSVLAKLSLPAGVNKCYGKLFIPAGSESCTKTVGHPLLIHRSAAFETKRTVSKNSKMFSGSKLA